MVTNKQAEVVNAVAVVVSAAEEVAVNNLVEVANYNSRE